MERYAFCEQYINPHTETCEECEMKYVCWAEPISTTTISWLEEMAKLEDELE